MTAHSRTRPHRARVGPAQPPRARAPRPRHRHRAGSAGRPRWWDRSGHRPGPQHRRQLHCLPGRPGRHRARRPAGAPGAGQRLLPIARDTRWWLVTTRAATPTTPDPWLVADPAGAGVLDPDPPTAHARSVPLRRGPGGQGDGVHRRRQPHRHADPLDRPRPTPQGQLIYQQLTRSCTSARLVEVGHRPAANPSRTTAGRPDQRRLPQSATCGAVIPNRQTAPQPSADNQADEAVRARREPST